MIKFEESDHTWHIRSCSLTPAQACKSLATRRCRLLRLILHYAPWNREDGACRSYQQTLVTTMAVPESVIMLSHTILVFCCIPDLLFGFVLFKAFVRFRSDHTLYLGLHIEGMMSTSISKSLSYSEMGDEAWGVRWEVTMAKRAWCGAWFSLKGLAARVDSCSMPFLEMRSRNEGWGFSRRLRPSTKIPF